MVIKRLKNFTPTLDRAVVFPSIIWLLMWVHEPQCLTGCCWHSVPQGKCVKFTACAAKKCPWLWLTVGLMDFQETLPFVCYTCPYTDIINWCWTYVAFTCYRRLLPTSES